MTTQQSANLRGFIVSVDPECCQGHNRCVLIAPEVFTTDEYGYASVKADATGVSLEKVKLAAQNCPERAITVVVTDDATPAEGADSDG